MVETRKGDYKECKCDQKTPATAMESSTWNTSRHTTKPDDTTESKWQMTLERG
jgi:hypothetical protein